MLRNISKEALLDRGYRCGQDRTMPRTPGSVTPEPVTPEPVTDDPDPRTAALFGRNIAAMVTPMHEDGTVDLPGVDRLVDHLLGTQCDGLVVAGTTGEAPTLTEVETDALIAAVVARTGGRARVVAGVGCYDTAATVDRARRAADAGADALLLVTPYYSRPTQAGLVAHLATAADATELPVMLYDIPVRTGIALAEETLRILAQHPRIHAVKDAKGDLHQALRMLSQTDLAYYCGIDELNLPYLAAGATGLVSVVAQVVGARTEALLTAVADGDLPRARRLNAALLPLVDAITGTGQGAVLAKTALAELGVLGNPAVRSPLLPAPSDQVATLRAALHHGGHATQNSLPSGSSITHQCPAGP
jgi:4-hydroxy-tetrahydrodipicolinate synthase